MNGLVKSHPIAERGVRVLWGNRELRLTMKGIVLKLLSVVLGLLAGQAGVFAQGASQELWVSGAIPNLEGRQNHGAVWTGSKMLVWGGTSVCAGCPATAYLTNGAIYDPKLNSWMKMSGTGVPAGSETHVAVWTGHEMLVWGQHRGNSGASYDPASDRWKTISTNGAPFPRRLTAAVWTGSEMLLWGGGGIGGEGFFNDGGLYNPDSDTWRRMTTNGAPAPRDGHKVVWTGTQMIVWGGFGFTGPLNDGGLYDPIANAWSPMATNGSPPAADVSTAIWTGKEMIFAGGRYDPKSNSWLPIADAAVGGSSDTAVWTGNESIVWGGDRRTGLLDAGARYNPADNIWTPLTTNGAPAGRYGHSAVWTGHQMVIFGGTDGRHYFNDVYVYKPPFPLLTVQVLTGDVVVSWSSNFAGLSLEESPGLGSSNWIPVSLSPTLIGSEYGVTISATGSARFYRLGAR